MISRRNQQQLVKIGLQFAHCVILRCGVVIGDGDEIEAAPRCRFYREDERTGNELAGLAGAACIAVPGVHVKVAAVPCRAAAQWSEQDRGFIRHQPGAGKENLDRVMRDHLRTNVGNADQHLPHAGRDRSWQARRGGVGKADGQRRFASPAPAAKAGGIEHSEIERRVLVAARVFEGEGDAFHARWYAKGNLQIRVVLRALDGAGQGKVRPRRGGACRGQKTEKTGQGEGPGEGRGDVTLSPRRKALPHEVQAASRLPRLAELGRVGRVEGLRPELQTNSFSKGVRSVIRSFAALRLRFHPRWARKLKLRVWARIP